MAKKRAENRGEVLVAIINNSADFVIARDEHWYRIPIASAEKWVNKRWPPEWIAFYLTKKLGENDQHSVRYFARVIGVRKASRQGLFPDELPSTKSHRWYYVLSLDNFQELPSPIFSRRMRRIVFIPTTWEKFVNAVEINDLWDESPLEDRLWAELKRWKIYAERQVFVTADGEEYALDFAVYCAKRNIDIETDGDTYHANKEKGQADNLRNNALTAAGWTILRFNTQQVREEADTYCIPRIVDTINELGGLDEDELLPRKVNPSGPDAPRQLGLFDSDTP